MVLSFTFVIKSNGNHVDCWLQALLQITAITQQSNHKEIQIMVQVKLCHGLNWCLIGQIPIKMLS